MCPVRTILTDILDACERELELEASQVHTAGFEATPASIGKRTEGAARNVLKAHADLGILSVVAASVPRGLCSRHRSTEKPHGEEEVSA